MFPSLPGLRFTLFGFPVTIGLDFFLITLILGLQVRPGPYIFEWLVVVAVAILIHELGHAFAYARYSIHPEIRLWGMGGLTISGFTLPPRRSILVSLAGPLVGVPFGLAAMVLQPWVVSIEPLWIILGDMVFVSLGWAILNLLPVAGLDGGHVVGDLFLIVGGQQARTPGQAMVGLCSIAIAVGAVAWGFWYLALVIFLFALMEPDPYATLWRVASARGGGVRRESRPSQPAPPEPYREERRKDRPVAVIAPDSKRAFAEAYEETLPPTRPDAEPIDLDEFEGRPAPLLPDVAAMVARRDDGAVAERLVAEADALAVFWIVTRVVEGKRVSQLLGALRRYDGAGRTEGLLKLQIALHSLGRFDESMAAASMLGEAGGPGSAVLEARSAARAGDRKRVAAALERVLALGPVRLSEPALADIARIAPDKRVAELLAKLRSRAPAV